VNVREANPADLPQLMGLLRAAPSAAQWSEEQLRKILGERTSRIVLLLEYELDSEAPAASRVRIEGFAVGATITPEAEIENIVVDPERQHRGLGRRLLNELIQRLQRAGCESVFLEVRASNRAACRLYEACGFAVVGRRMNYYSQPTEDAVLYRFSARRVASPEVQI